MSLLLLKIDHRSKRTEKMVKELREERAAGTVTPTSVHLLQFTISMQRFFAGSGDKNGGVEKRKKRAKERRLEKGTGRKDDENGNKKRKETFESSEEDDGASKSSETRAKNLTNSFSSSSEDVADSSDSVCTRNTSSDSDS